MRIETLNFSCFLHKVTLIAQRLKTELNDFLSEKNLFGDSLAESGL